MSISQAAHTRSKQRSPKHFPLSRQLGLLSGQLQFTFAQDTLIRSRSSAALSNSKRFGGFAHVRSRAGNGLASIFSAEYSSNVIQIERHFKIVGFVSRHERRVDRFDDRRRRNAVLEVVLS